uniref:(S)-2-hydroxy-acid oxidase n=1 Tax=Amblyomma maculatum TaxID=34609 RepID=G3MPZ0_AMBMU
MCISDIHRLANEKLETAVRLYYDSGAGEEQTLRENREAFNRLRFRPKLLMDVSRVNTETTLLGSAVSMPVGFAPSVMQQLAHPDGETGTAQAAEAAGTVMILSALSTVSLEEVRHSAPNCTLWLQTFLFKDRALTESLVKRAADAGFSAIVLTVDSPLFGHEMKPSKCRFSLPNNFRLSNLERSLPKTNATAFDLFVDDLISQSGVWSDIAWLRSVSGLPVVVKGVLTPEAAVNSLRSGAAAIIVSNHGGRQLDGTPASIEALPVILAAVGESLEVYLDSGVRTGADVAKALALGTRAVFIGRPVLWGLAYNGKEGVSTVLHIIKNELERTLKLLGCSDISALSEDYVVNKDYYSAFHYVPSRCHAASEQKRTHQLNSTADIKRYR